jgi:multiple sugar transport system permease protein
MAIQGGLPPIAPPSVRRWMRRPSQPRRRHEIGDTLLGRWIRVYIPILLFMFITLFPFYWMFVTSFKSPSELLDFNQTPLFIIKPTLDHYRHLFTETNFLHWSLNTMVVAVVSTGASLVCSVLAGYSLARLRYRGANGIGWGIFVTYLVPPTLLFLPLAYVIRQLHLFNNLWSLIITYPTFLIPFSTWLLIGYFKAIPRELEESALVDGATRFQAMLRIAIPLALPGILSAGIFAFTLSWNEFLYSLIFMNDSVAKTIPVGVTSELIRGDEFFWGELMAASLLGSIPVALLYSFFVDHFVAGLTAGAVKG